MSKRIAIHDADGTKFPNLALLKLIAWHRQCGDVVERFMPLYEYDTVYSSKVFSWTPSNYYLPANTIKGGTGYDIHGNLPDNIEHICPAYDFAGLDYSLGFLTRGCIRSCPWCVVPQKEGELRAHADIEEFLRHRDVILMDNNILAHDHGIQQIEKMARLGVRVDFNQGLDARLIDKQIAKRLAKLKWLKPVRLACDKTSQMKVVGNAVKVLRSAGVKPQNYFCYVLVQEIDDALERVEFLRSLKVRPFAQPYREIRSAKEPAKILKHFARWVNHTATFETVSWDKYLTTVAPQMVMETI